MLNLNVMGETKYLANMQIYTACHRKYQNKSSLMLTTAICTLLWVIKWSDCAALLVTSPHLLSSCLPSCPAT